MTESDLEIIKPRPKTTIVVLRGEHDLSTRDKLATTLNDRIEIDDLIIVDLSEVSFIDSSILGVLARADRRAETAGKRFRLQLGTAPIVERILEISGMLEHLDCVPSRNLALAD